MKRRLEETFFEIRKIRRNHGASSNGPILHQTHSPKILQQENEAVTVASDVSSLSSGVSRISGSDDSVSAVSSEDFSISNVEEGEIVDDALPLGANYSGLLNKFDNAVDIETRIAAVKRDAERIHTLNRLLVTADSVVNLYATGLHTLWEAHQSLCYLASAHMLLLRSKQENTASQKIVECYKDLYTELISLHSRLLNLCQQNKVKCVAAFAPYSIDMLTTILPTLLESFKDSKSQPEALFMFKSLVHSTLLKCCSLTEHLEEEVRIISVKAIFHILTTLLPIEGILIGHTRDGSAIGEIQQENINSLIQLLHREYIANETFKPASVVLLQLQHNLGINAQKRNKAENSSGECLRKVAFEIANVATQVGCTKRQFPVAHLNTDHCNLEDVTLVLKNFKKNNDYAKSAGPGDRRSSDAERLWQKAKYWLLLLLEDSNAHVRNLALCIIRHVMVTTSFVEKDRQHVMSLVMDCLSDDATFKCAMAVVVAVSHIYPLKDGAVKRVSNLTLKGSGIRGRMDVISSFGNCYFTKKGTEAFISILQTLCEPIGADQVKYFNSQCATSSVTNHDSEILFSRSEWPRILATLAGLKKSIKAGSSILTTASGGNNPNWISTLWAYITESDGRNYLLNASSRSEASLRFSNIVSMKTNPTEHGLLLEANRTYASLLSFSKGDIKLESLKGKAAYLHIHRNRVRNGCLGVRKLLDSCQVAAKAGLNSETGKKCHCIDCIMDKMITSSKVKRPLNNLDDISGCLACGSTNYTTATEISLETASDDISLCNRYGGEAIVGYYRKFMKNKPEEYETINDIDCITFPSHLGASLVLKSSHRSPHPKGVGLRVESPTVIGSDITNQRFHSTFEVESTQGSNVVFKTHVMHPVPTMYPIPIVVTPMVYKKSRKILGDPRTIWIHPKRNT